MTDDPTITSTIVDIFNEGISCSKKQLKKILKKTKQLDLNSETLDYHLNKLVNTAIITIKNNYYTLSDINGTGFIPEYLEGLANRIAFTCDKEPSSTGCSECNRFKGCMKYYHEIPAKKGGSKQQAYVLLAKHIQDNIRILTRTDNEVMLWYNEETGIWEDNADTVIRYIVRKSIPKISKNGSNELIDKIKTSTFTNPDVFDRRNILALANGVLNLDLWNFNEHSHLNYLTRRLEIFYDEKAECPAIKQFLGEILPSDKIDLVHELVGYCLWPHYDIHKAFMFTGKGSNGKSTLILLIQEFLGAVNVSSVELQELINNRYKPAELYGKMVNLAADLPSTALTKTGLFKALTGGDWVTAEKKNQHPFQFRNNAKMIFSANEIPATVRDDTDAFYRRWIIMNFPYQFTSNAIPQEILLEQLTTPEELSGLLNLAINGLKNLRKRRHFDQTLDFDQQRKDYILQSDTIKAFVLYHCILDTDLKISKDDLYSSYVSYCQSEGKSPKLNNVFGREIKRWANGIDTIRPKINGVRRMFWSGITTKIEYENSESGKDGTDGRDAGYLPSTFSPGVKSTRRLTKNPVILAIPDTGNQLVTKIHELMIESAKNNGSIRKRIIISKLPGEDPERVVETLELMMDKGIIFMPREDQYKLVG